MSVPFRSAWLRAMPIVVVGSVVAIVASLTGAQQSPTTPAPAPTPPPSAPAPAAPAAPGAPAAAPSHARRRAIRAGLDAGAGAAANGPGQALSGQGPCAARDDGNHAVGLVQQCAAAGAARRVRRFDRLRDDDAFAQPGRARGDDRADQEAAHRFPGPRSAHADGPRLHRGRRAGRRAQGPDQQDRAPSLRNELQRSRNVRPVSGQVPRRPGQVLLPRPRSQDRRVRARDRNSVGAVPRHARRCARRAGSVQLGASRAATPAISTSAT